LKRLLTQLLLCNLNGIEQALILSVQGSLFACVLFYCTADAAPMSTGSVTFGATLQPAFPA